MLQRYVGMLVIRGDEESSGSFAAPTFHVLRETFIQPGRTATKGFLHHEAVGEFVHQHAGQFIGDGGQAADGDAQSPVIKRASPSGGAGDVAKSFLGVENYSNGFSRSKTKLRFEASEIIFERAQDFGSQLGRGVSLVVHAEMASLAFAKAAFGVGIPLNFF